MGGNLPRTWTSTIIVTIPEVLKGTTISTWSIRYEVREMKQLLSVMDCCLMHRVKESNKGADYLANWGYSHQKNFTYI